MTDILDGTLWLTTSLQSLQTEPYIPYYDYVLRANLNVLRHTSSKKKSVVYELLPSYVYIPPKDAVQPLLDDASTKVCNPLEDVSCIKDLN